MQESLVGGAQALGEEGSRVASLAGRPGGDEKGQHAAVFDRDAASLNDRPVEYRRAFQPQASGYVGLLGQVIWSRVTDDPWPQLFLGVPHAGLGPFPAALDLCSRCGDLIGLASPAPPQLDVVERLVVHAEVTGGQSSPRRVEGDGRVLGRVERRPQL